jgi:excinuclease ABC subunit A
MSDKIIIRGAREHNLKNISVEIPRDRLVVITGLSGSGKSSLAFDTIYAEGQRRYVESLSAYARQFLEQMEKPDVDTIEGLSPAISIEQKTTSRNPRSTVGTVTEIHDYLRLLFARAGRPHCYQCGKEIQSQTIQQIVDQIMALSPGTRLQLFSPIIRGRKGEYRKEFDHLRKSGYARVRVDGAIRDLSEEISLDKNKKHTLEVLVDRLVVKEGAAKRLADSLATAMNLSEGIVKVEVAGGEELVFKFACVDCGISCRGSPPVLPAILRACPQCDGLGTTNYFDPDLIVPDPDLSIREGAIIPWQARTSMYFHAILQSLADHYQIDLYAPFKTLSPQMQKTILYGSDGEQIKFYHDRGEQRHFYYRDFEGVIPQLERRYRETDSEIIREEMEKYMNIRPCPVCQGARLRKESLFVKVGGLNIHEVTEKSIRQALDFFARLELNPREREIARRILKEISERLGFLLNVGLDYLTLSRSSATLSGGESERIRLATQIGSGLVGVLYILDEPSIGLHQRDNARLFATLKRLRDLGNTILVVEHDDGNHSGGRLRPGPRPRGRGPRGRACLPGDSAGPAPIGSLPHREVSFRQAEDSRAGATKEEPGEIFDPDRSRGEQPEGHNRKNPPGPAYLRDRSFRVGEKYPGHRYALPGPGAENLPLQGETRQGPGNPGAFGNRQGNRDRSIPHRADAPLQPGHLHRSLHPHPGSLCPAPRVPGPRVSCRPVQLQRQGRPV